MGLHSSDAPAMTVGARNRHLERLAMDIVGTVRALMGGVMIGLACCMLLQFNGRIAGISGIAGGWMAWRPGEVSWRAAFLLGLAVGALLLLPFSRAVFDTQAPASLGRLVAAGLLVGSGTRLANGCTSGHGVCGISRMSVRSVVATATFMASAVAVGLVTRTAGAL
jgi:uncharacterized protein